MANIQNAKAIHTPDLYVNGSFKNIQVSSANRIMPILNPINLLGYTNPPNASAICFVAIIEPYDTTTPTDESMIGLSLAHLLKNWRCD